jgi:hypothetical protein
VENLCCGLRNDVGIFKLSVVIMKGNSKERNKKNGFGPKFPLVTPEATEAAETPAESILNRRARIDMSRQLTSTLGTQVTPRIQNMRIFCFQSGHFLRSCSSAHKPLATDQVTKRARRDLLTEGIALAILLQTRQLSSYNFVLEKGYAA